MVTLAKRGKNYTLTITDDKGKKVGVQILTWKQIAKLYCLISGIICKRIRGKS